MNFVQEPSTIQVMGSCFLLVRDQVVLLNIFCWWDLCLVCEHRVFNTCIRAIKYIPSSPTTTISKTQNPIMSYPGYPTPALLSETHDGLTQISSPPTLPLPHYYQTHGILPSTHPLLSKTSDGSDPALTQVPSDHQTNDVLLSTHHLA